MGFFLSILTALILSSKDMMSKKISRGTDGTTSAFASFLFALPFYAILLITLFFAGLEDFFFSGAFITLVVLRAVTDCFAEWFKMHAFSFGDISLVSCFFSLSTVFMLITSPLITGDQITFLGGLGVCLAVIGTMIAGYKPKRHSLEDNRHDLSLHKKQIKGICFATIAAFMFSLNSCFDRLAVKYASPTLSAFSMTLLSAIFLLPTLRGNKARYSDLKLHFKDFSLRGLLEVTFMVTKLTALRYIQAPYLSGICNISTLISIVGGKVVFKEEEFLRRLLAGIIITSGVILIILTVI